MNTRKSIILIVLTTILFSFGVALAQNDALIHQYKFDGNLEDAVADSHAVFSDGWWLEPVADNYIAGHDGTEPGALNFDGGGGGGYIIYCGRWSAVQEGTVNEMTLTLWGLWYGNYADNTQDIINKRDNYEPPDMVWGFNKPGGADNVNLAVKRRGASAQSTIGFDENVWTHIAVTMDGINVKFYKNGVPADELPYEFGTGWNARIHMGSAGNSDGSYREVDAFNGALDDVRFYSRKLTDSEILNIYQGNDVVGVEDEALISASRFDLAQNYPNPFNPTTQIEYTLHKSTRVEISVFDLLGHKITTLVNEAKNTGSHKVIWDASEASAGVYFYQMKAGDKVETRKMLLVK